MSSPSDDSASFQKKHLRPIIIIGAGGHAVSVANVAISAGYELKYFVDQDKKGMSLLGHPIIAGLNEIKDLHNYFFAIAVGDNVIREKIYNELIAGYADLKFPFLVHPSACISIYADLGDGVVVMPQAVVGPNSIISKFCIINTQASVDHDSIMLSFSSLAPGVVTGGGVKIGARSAICIGASIKHGLKIGDDSVLGANSYLHEDLSPNSVAFGVPAKKIRFRKPGDKYLK